MAKWLIYSKTWEKVRKEVFATKEVSVTQEDPVASIETVTSRIRGSMTASLRKEESRVSDLYPWASTVKKVLTFCC